MYESVASDSDDDEPLANSRGAPVPVSAPLAASIAATSDVPQRDLFVLMIFLSFNRLVYVGPRRRDSWEPGSSRVMNAVE